MRFVGTWKLESYERRSATGGITRPYGEHPVGQLMYDAAGHMSAQLMAPDGGYLGYFGTYTVLDAENTVLHRVEGCVRLNWVGSDQRRAYEFTGDRLILTAIRDGNTNRLVWARA